MPAQPARLTNAEIAHALAHKHFEVVFQPVFRLHDGGLLRHECFVRWCHPDAGQLSSNTFMPALEAAGRMKDMTRYILENAIPQYHAWRGTAGPGFSINLTEYDLEDDSFALFFSQTLARYAFPAENITLECPILPTEMSLTSANRIFERLRDTGAKLSIEIRGRANELIKNIHPFPFDEVKTGGRAILRSARTMRGRGGLNAVAELLELAKTNNAGTIAVGIRNKADLQALARLGFSGAQGSFLGREDALSAFAIHHISTVRSHLDLPSLSHTQLRGLCGLRQSLAPSHRHEKECVAISENETTKVSPISQNRTPHRVMPPSPHTQQNIPTHSGDPLHAQSSQTGDVVPSDAGLLLGGPLGGTLDESSFTSPPPNSDTETTTHPMHVTATQELDIPQQSASPQERHAPATRNDTAACISPPPLDDSMSAMSHRDNAAFIASPHEHNDDESLLPIMPEDLRTEDEILDEVLAQTQLLDPLTPDSADTQLVANTPAPAQLPADTACTTDRLRSDAPQYHDRPNAVKNFLTRKYRITHFWPHSWRYAWNSRRVRRKVVHRVRD